MRRWIDLKVLIRANLSFAELLADSGEVNLLTSRVQRLGTLKSARSFVWHLAGIWCFITCPCTMIAKAY